MGNHTMVHGNTKINMDNLGWCPLQERRSKLKIPLLFKITKDLSIVNKTDLTLTNSPRRPSCFFPRSEKDLSLLLLPLHYPPLELTASSHQKFSISLQF